MALQYIMCCICLLFNHTLPSQYKNKSAGIKFAFPISIQKTHILLQHSDHRDYLFLWLALLDVSPGNGLSAHWFGIELPWAVAQLRMPLDHGQNMNKCAIACREYQTATQNKRFRKKSAEALGTVPLCDYFLITDLKNI